MVFARHLIQPQSDYNLSAKVNQPQRHKKGDRFSTAAMCIFKYCRPVSRQLW